MLGIRPGRGPLVAEIRCDDRPDPPGVTAPGSTSPVRHDDPSTRVIISRRLLAAIVGAGRNTSGQRWVP
jgi:hypothetical protein